MRLFVTLLTLAVFLISGCGKKEETNTSQGTVNKTETTVKTETKSGAEDINAMLDSYEKVVKKYAELNGKIKDDPSLTAELSSLATKQVELTGKLEHAKGSMTKEQLEKYTTIMMKFAESNK